MAKHNLASKNTIHVLLFICSICFCYGSCDTPVGDQQAPAVDDFIDNISAHYKNEIQIIEAELFHVEYAFKKQLSILQFEQELVAKTTRKLESRMRSIAALNYKTKLCVQHYMSNVTTENVNLQTKLRTCVDTAQVNSKSIADNVRNQIRNSRTQLNELTNTDLVACGKNNGNNNQKLVDCVREKLKLREINIQNMLKAAKTDIENCLCKTDRLAETAQECSFQVILEVYTLLSEMVSNINTCIGDRMLEIK